MESLIKFVQDEFVTKKEIPSFKSGDTITVYYEIREYTILENSEVKRLE